MTQPLISPRDFTSVIVHPKVHPKINERHNMEASNSNMQFYVPSTFWDDHADRCPCDGDPEVAMASELARKGARVLIAGSPAQIECLRSDAAYYCDRSGPDECPPQIKRSAKATLDAIAKAKGGAE